ncbi:MAG TPA: DHH family phosphoesterase [Candidatus Bacteroides merdavium]|uniref:DHH family phosphoesterase n=1 Tax=Candidatus Bacteroides merdavium TaxID=2838472 RepID=A0A9D2KDI2_9BACE|nr:DHH family phosphoesterase [uncultured Bacteroides sp.]HIZ92000.1 DHH family phosphoesterase [Candidatus Bacteroides merdavium]
MLSKVIAQANIDHFAKWLDHAERMVIVTHVGPDGDAIGSSLGLWHFLNSQEKTANIIVPNAFPDFLKWMPGSKDILQYDRYKEFADQLIAEADVICCLDFNALSRIDAMADAVRNSPARKILIDHHLHPEDFCRIVISHPEISSTSELIFRLICRMGYFSDITKQGAECIYTGMMTDTGGFTYNSNNREIYFIISELLSKGIDKDAIYRKVFNTYSESRLRLMGHVLTQMKVYPEYRTALISLTEKEQKQFSYIRGDSEGFVNIPLSIKNVVFSCFLREDTEKPMIKISLRSVGTFPCNQLAAEFFGGGGHLNASGGEFYGTMEEARQVFEQALEKYKPLLNAKG